jgi:hypothetical protein
MGDMRARHTDARRQDRVETHLSCPLVVPVATMWPLNEPLTERNQPLNPDGKGYEEMKDDRIQKVERKNGRLRAALLRIGYEDPPSAHSARRLLDPLDRDVRRRGVE